MIRGGVAFDEAADRGAARSFDASDAAFNAELLREQYRALARLGPYVHGVVIVAALAFFGMAAPAGSLITGILLPAALIAISLFRLVSWLKARPSAEDEGLDRARREVRTASLLGPALTFAFATTTAISAWQRGQAEFVLALLAVWVVAAVCAICLNRIVSEANGIVLAATAPLVVAFLGRGAELTLGLAVLVAVAAGFIIRLLEEHFRLFAEIVWSRFVIAEKQRIAEEAHQAAMAIALTDDLTKLPNRRCFQSLLAGRIRTATESGGAFALGLIDLDGFKPINDVFGHPAGDQILRQVAALLAKAMDGRGSAARIGGDEFAVLCERIAARDEAIALGQEIQALFATQFDGSPFSANLSCACGFALFPMSAADPDELVRLADAALYRAKAGGPGGAAVFEAAVETRSADRDGLGEALRRAVAESAEAVRLAPAVDPASRMEPPNRLRA
ncbi:MAG TPA: diguanylate cyclase [Roseiarcus sp.]|nr:diguanylate cyclase [Roseiarcus sp.]